MLTLRKTRHAHQFSLTPDPLYQSPVGLVLLPFPNPKRWDFIGLDHPLVGEHSGVPMVWLLENFRVTDEPAPGQSDQILGPLLWSEWVWRVLYKLVVGSDTLLGPDTQLNRVSIVGLSFCKRLLCPWGQLMNPWSTCTLRHPPPVSRFQESWKLGTSGNSWIPNSTGPAICLQKHAKLGILGGLHKKSSPRTM